MKKKLVALALATSMFFSLCACSSGAKGEDEKPLSEAKEEVADNETTEPAEAPVATEEPFSDEEMIDLLLSQTDTLDSYSMKIFMDVSATGELDEETRADLESLGNDPEDIDMSVAMTIEMQMDVTESIIYSHGNFNMSMMGMTFDLPMEEYTDIENEIKYSNEYDYATGTTAWTKSELADKDTADLSAFESVQAPVLSETDDYYIINGIASDTTMVEGALEGVSEEVESLSQVPITLKFDKETKYLLSVEYDISEALTKTEDGTTFNNCEFRVDLLDHNNVSVAIPATVISSATEAGESFNTDPSAQESGALNLAQAISGLSYMYPDDIISMWLYQYPAIGSSYVYMSDNSNEIIDDIILSLQVYLNDYTEEELIQYLDNIEYCADEDVAALILLGDLDYLSGDYRTKMQKMVKDKGLTDSLGATYYKQLCGID